MAIYHLSAQLIKRSAGQSSTAAAAYRAGVRLGDRRTGEVHDYTGRSGVDHSAILAPDGVPSWVHCRADLWNEVEQIEKRKDAQVAREIDIALPIELTNKQKISLIYEFVKSEFVELGMVADINVHDINSHNPHAHILLTTRTIDQDGFGKKNRDWNSTDLIERWRKNWALAANKHLEMAGQNARIDHRSLADQGSDLVPQIHLGKKNVERMKRGETNPRIERYNRIKLKNEFISVTREIKEIPDSVFIELDKHNSELIDDAILANDKYEQEIISNKNKLVAAERKLNLLNVEYSKSEDEMTSLADVVSRYPSKNDVRNINAVREFKAQELKLSETSKSISSIKSFIVDIREKIVKLVQDRNYILSGIKVFQAQQAQIRPRLQRIFGAAPPAQAQPRAGGSRHRRPEEPGL